MRDREGQSQAPNPYGNDIWHGETTGQGIELDLDLHVNIL